MAPPIPQQSLSQLVDEVTAAYIQAINDYFNQFKRDSDKLPQEEDAVKLIVDLDERLEEASNQVNEHQRVQTAIVDTKAKIAKIDAWIRQVVAKLLEMDHALDRWLSQARAKVAYSSIGGRVEELEEETVIDFGQRISGSTSAPVLWQTGDPLGLHRPPNPQEELIRASMLFQLQHLSKSQDIEASAVVIDQDIVTDKQQEDSMIDVHHIFNRPVKSERAANRNLLQMDLDDTSDEE